MRRILCVFLFFSCASISFASDGRDDLIAQQLDCVEQHAADTGIDWNDVCYMGTRNNHSRIVTSALDSMERNPSYSQASNQELSLSSSDVMKKDEINTNKEIQKGPLNIETTVDLTHRWDSLKWNQGPYNSPPNILSELTWKNVKIVEFENSGRMTLDNRFILLDWRGGIGWVYRGQNQDSDYWGNNRTLEFSRSNNKAELGKVYDLSVGTGMRFDVTRVINKEGKDNFALKKLYLDLLGGYSYNQTQYFMTDGNQTVPSSGSFPGLKSNFQAQWKGLWIGGDLKGTMDKWHGLLRYEYHWLDYYAKANWNLRPEFMHPKSYDQTSEGNGSVLIGSGGYNITPFWSIDLTAQWHSFKANQGNLKIFLSSGATPEQRLNEAVWTSISLSIGNTFHF